MTRQLTPSNWTVWLDHFGHLGLTDAEGIRYNQIAPIRAYPLSAPRQHWSLVSSTGTELVWIEDIDTIPPPARTLIEDALEARELMPEIQQIVSVASFSTPSTWTVNTDRGQTQFILQAEEDIRRLPDRALLIMDRHGVSYRIRDRFALDRNSRKLLDRFL
jgi:cation diffusion facilitator CzcD-associated flavoprotein CzcO